MTASRLHCFQTIDCDHLTTANSCTKHHIYIDGNIPDIINVTSLSAQDFQEKEDRCASFAFLLERPRVETLQHYS